MQREGQPRLKGTPRSSTRPHRHHERVAMRDPLRDALSRTRLSSTRRSGASESLCLETPSRALDDTGRVGVRGGMRGDRARRRRLPTPRHSPTPRRALPASYPVRSDPGQPLGSGGRPPFGTPSPDAECEASGRVVAAPLGASSGAPREGGLPRPPRCQAARARLARGGAGRAWAEEPSALTVAEAERSQHEGQHGDDLGIHGTGGRRADAGGTRSERGGGE